MNRREVDALSRRELITRSSAAAGMIMLGEPSGARPGSESVDADLPPGVKAVWEIKSAHSEKTSTRERVCINGLWRWQPADAADTVPMGSWGWFKVPGPWPGITDYLQKNYSQAVGGSATVANDVKF